MILEGFADVSETLRCGVYALVYQGVVVYVGQSKCMLTRIYSHRNARRSKDLPKWFPIKGIQFDEIHVRPCHPDRIDALERELINLYKPRHNTQLKTTLPIGKPFNIVVGEITIPVNAGGHPYLPRIERRV